MAQTLVNIRMDERLKRSMEKTCQELGMTMTTAFNIFVKKAVKEQRIPFEITADPFYNSANMERLRKSINDAENGKLTVHDLIEVEDE